MLPTVRPMTAAFPFGVRLIVAYDGTDFHGWQMQPGQRTIQGVLAEAIQTMSPSSEVRGASRTDAGVHAEEQVASFATAREIPPHGWVRGLNGVLPEDVAVREASPCDAGFDPRDYAIGKTYRYFLYFAETRDPALRNRAWHIPRSRALPGRDREWLDLDAMKAAGDILVGTHDFASFQASNDHRDNTIRTVRRIEIIPRCGADSMCAIDVEGTAFLKNMVRILVGTLVEVGRHRFELGAVKALLTAPNRQNAGPTAPAHGLVLRRVFLGNERR